MSKCILYSWCNYRYLYNLSFTMWSFLLSVIYVLGPSSWLPADALYCFVTCQNILPSNTNFVEAYASGTSEEQVLFQIFFLHNKSSWISHSFWMFMLTFWYGLCRHLFKTWRCFLHRFTRWLLVFYVGIHSWIKCQEIYPAGVSIVTFKWWNEDKCKWM